MKALPYSLIAPFYDALHMSLAEDVAFVMELARQAGSPVLELGCGTGRILIPLVRDGIKVTGLDNSEEMLAICRSRLSDEDPAIQQNANVMREDMTAFNLGRQYQLVVASYNTLTHFPQSTLTRVFRCGADHLEPGGLFFLDLPNPYALTRHGDVETFENQQLFEDEKGLQYQIQARSGVNVWEQCVSAEWRVLGPLGNKDSTEQAEFAFDHYYYFPHQIDLIFEKEGIARAALYGDYDSSPFDEDSERLLILGRSN